MFTYILLISTLSPLNDTSYKTFEECQVAKIEYLYKHPEATGAWCVDKEALYGK